MKFFSLLIASIAISMTMAVGQIAITNNFTGTSADPLFNWDTDIALDWNDSLIVHVNDSIGPQQPGGSAAHYRSVQWILPNRVNMTSNKTVSFKIKVDQPMSLYIQVQDTLGRYTDASWHYYSAAGQYNTVMNFSGNYKQHGANAGDVDSTVIEQINFQAMGPELTMSPWQGKYKGTYVLDDIMVGGTNIVAAINNHYINADISLYPNPTDGKVIVDNKSSFKVTGLKVYDLSGTEVFSQNENLSSVELVHLGKGLYFMKVETDNGVLMKKITVQ
jgi:hypothetical protein